MGRQYLHVLAEKRARVTQFHRNSIKQNKDTIKGLPAHYRKYDRKPYTALFYNELYSLAKSVKMRVTRLRSKTGKARLRAWERIGCMCPGKKLKSLYLRFQCPLCIPGKLEMYYGNGTQEDVQQLYSLGMLLCCDHAKRPLKSDPKRYSDWCRAQAEAVADLPQWTEGETDIKAAVIELKNKHLAKTEEMNGWQETCDGMERAYNMVIALLHGWKLEILLEKIENEEDVCNGTE